MKRLILFTLISLLASTANAALTKSVAAVDEWAEIAQNAVREGATTDVSGCYAATLHIDIALTSATAHTGTRIVVQVSSEESGDEGWTDLSEFVGPIGTADAEALTATEPVAETVIACASTTGLYDDDGSRWIFIEDNTVANSELIYVVSHSANASVTAQDGLANEHDTSDTMYDIAKRYIITLPMTANRVRVIYDNTYDSDGATVHTHTRISKVTGL